MTIVMNATRGFYIQCGTRLPNKAQGMISHRLTQKEQKRGEQGIAMEPSFALLHRSNRCAVFSLKQAAQCILQATFIWREFGKANSATINSPDFSITSDFFKHILPV